MLLSYEERFRQLCRLFPERVQRALHNLDASTCEALQEIRLRSNRPVQLSLGLENLFLDVHGTTSTIPHADCVAITPDELTEVFRAGCSYSVHSHQAQIAQGFVQLAGGHRMGICGTAVTTDGSITSIRDFSSLNIRVAKEVLGCADKALQCSLEGHRGILVAGPPSSGKTTLLRDMARQLASGLCGPVQKVALVDERGEFAASWQGVAQNDVGICTDVLTGFEKADGIRMAIRTLSPDYIICDEIGGEADIQALKAGVTCGVRLIVSTHAATVEELLQKPFVSELAAMHALDVALLLEDRGQVGTIKQVLRLETNMLPAKVKMGG